MKHFIAGAILGALLMLSTGASAGPAPGNMPRTTLPRMCILAREGRYSEAMPCSLAYELHAQGFGNVWISAWVKP